MHGDEELEDRPEVPGDEAPHAVISAPETDPKTLPLDEGDKESALKEEAS